MTTSADGNGYISRGNMNVVVSVIGLAMVAFGGFNAYQNSNTDRRISELREDARSFLKKEEHEEFKLRIDKDLGRLEHGLVPRPENEARLKTLDDFSKLLSDRINEVRGNLASITTPQSQFSRMETEIADLRRQLNEAMLKRGP